MLQFIFVAPREFWQKRKNSLAIKSLSACLDSADFQCNLEVSKTLHPNQMKSSYMNFSFLNTKLFRWSESVLIIGLIQITQQFFTLLRSSSFQAKVIKKFIVNCFHSELRSLSCSNQVLASLDCQIASLRNSESGVNVLNLNFKNLRKK